MSYVVCAPYYSLPEFPQKCKIVTNRDVSPRDILLCNPSNFHIKGGVQYDPHLETFEYLNCQPMTRISIDKRINNYTDIKILFRTRFIKLNGDSKYLVTGYYQINSKSNKICRDAPVIMAYKAKFVSIFDSVDITSLLKEKKAYRSCFTTENPKWKPYLLDWISQIDRGVDRTREYVQEIKKLKKTYGANEFNSPEKTYKLCSRCPNKDSSCPLFKRINRFGTPPMLASHFE